MRKREGRRKTFEQGLRNEVRAVDLFQPRITQCQSQYQTKVKNYNLYSRLRFLGIDIGKYSIPKTLARN